MVGTFPKSEKLCGEQAVDHLYKNGKRFVVWPLRVTYLLVDHAPTQVLIWAPKSLFKHAVDRNRLRRQMREAYRLNKYVLEETGKYFHWLLLTTLPTNTPKNCRMILSIPPPMTARSSISC